MTPSQTSNVKTWTLVGLLVVLCSAGNLFFSIGMKRIGALHGWSTAALRAAFVAIFTSPWIWLGIVSMLLFLAALMLVLSWADFSYVLPATASMYVVIPLLGHFLLGEPVTATHWSGIALICLGVALVGRTPARTTGRSGAPPCSSHTPASTAKEG
jgi:drug/metabolite transporter (DMT)-like permease